MLELRAFQSIVENIPTGVVILDQTCNVLLINQPGIELLNAIPVKVSHAVDQMTPPATLSHFGVVFNPLFSPPASATFNTAEGDVYCQSHPLQLDGKTLIQINISRGRPTESTADPVATTAGGPDAQLERYKTLLHITSELAYTLEEDLILVRALDLLAEAIQTTEASILLVDEDTGEFTIRSTIEMGGKAKLANHPTGLWPNMGLAGLVLRKRETIALQDTYQNPNWIDKSQGKNTNHGAVVGAPLEYGHEGIGVLTLSKRGPQTFSDHEIELVSAAASRISNALYIAHLYDLIRNQAARLGSMLREEQISAAKNQAILESIADGVLVADESGEIILANDAILAILNENRRRLIGEDIDTLSGLYGTGSEPWSQTIKDWKIGRGLKEKPSLQDLLLMTDSRKEVRVHLSPVFAGGQFFGTVSIFRDVSAEMEADRVKTDFVSRVSHELRTPLTSIKGYADLMLMGATGPLTDKITQYIHVIKTNANRLHELVGDLLDISQFEAGNTSLEIKNIDLSALVHAVIEQHFANRMRVEKKPMRSEIEIEADLPPVAADRLRVEQILTNLIDNAFNYTPADGLIKISAVQHQDMINVTVADTGYGIQPEDREKIFDRFYRSNDERVQSISGTGLGLPIVKTLVELHGGEITVSSQPDKGSVFVFSLPIAKNM